MNPLRVSMRSGFLYKLLNLIGTPDENRTHNCPLGVFISVRFYLRFGDFLSK